MCADGKVASLPTVPGSFLLGKDLRIPLYPVPLCSAVVDVAIQDYVADVASELTYQNKSRTSSEVIFVFPLAPHMTIYSFQALNEDAKVQAMLHDEVPAFREEWGNTRGAWNEQPMACLGITFLSLPFPSRHSSCTRLQRARRTGSTFSISLSIQARCLPASWVPCPLARRWL